MSYLADQPQQVVHVYHEGKSPSTAALLEVLLGLFAQIFGVGHIYAGRVGRGIAIMVSYWILQAINVFLAFFLIGIVTGALTLLIYLIASPISAANACRPPIRR